MNYSLGLDIGTASVGWAVINEDKKRIEDLGVRIFERPEQPKNGDPLALERRTARSARRRLKRRRERLNFLKQFFIKKELLSSDEINDIFKKLQTKKNRDVKIYYNPYHIRVKAIKEKVPNDQLFVALYHIAKRRGYKSNRKKVEEADKVNDGQKVLGAIKANEAILAKYDSVGEALLKDKKYSAHKRNKLDSYTNSFMREDFEAEIRKILERQKWSDDDIEELLTQKNRGLFYQRPFMDADLVNKMRGSCQLEKGERRAWKASYSFELFNLAQNLSHLHYNQGNKLTQEQIAACVDKAKNTRTVKYKAIRECIGYKDDPNFYFDYIRGKREATYEAEEAHTFCELKFFHDIKKATVKNPSDWNRILNDIDLFDKIGYILTFYKEDAKVEQALKDLELSSDSISGLMKLSYSGFSHLSVKALRKLTPHLLGSDTYDKAVEQEYPNQFAEKLSGDANTLPPLDEFQSNQITNPVVKRAINQTRKVVNAVVKKYGAPAQIKIECANELAKNFRDRKAIKKAQDENAANNQRIYELLKNDFKITTPNGLQITKYKLREEQCCKCAYCGKALGPEVFLKQHAAEIDHIIPYSRCGNDSLSNKVLVCPPCNQEKTRQTPYEKWGSDKERWQLITTLTQASKMPFNKKKRILASKPPKEDWNVRALNDTRYATRFISNYIKNNLKFSNSSHGKRKVLLPNGNITNQLRKIYKIGHKDRDLNNTHHAVDACIIATISDKQIKKFAEWNKYKELGANRHTVFYNDDNGNPIQVSEADFQILREELLPWENFDKEVRIRSGMNYDSDKIEKLADFRDKFRDFANYDKDFLSKIHPIFVSRMPKRSAKGKAHQETLRSPKDDGSEKVMRLTRKRLIDCSLKDIENSVLPESDRVLYEQLKQLYQEKGKKAFQEPVYKNNKKVDQNGNQISPVTTIKVYSSQPNGILINNKTQFVNNGKTVCLNVYRRNNKYYCAPIFLHSLNEANPKILPTPKGKNKAEKADLQSIREKDGSILANPENGFEFCFSIFPNDYVRITFADKIVEGYYVKYHITAGTFYLMRHNQTSKENSSLIQCSAQSALDIKKLNISVLGDNYLPAE